MNQYVKIPRGININPINDYFIRKAIEEIGKHYSGVLLGKFGSDYAKGKAYISREFGLSKTAIKKLHKVKNSTRGHNDFGDSYSNYVSIHILSSKNILDNIIKSIKKENIDFIEIVNAIGNGRYDLNSMYIEVLFEETMHWIRQSLMDANNFCGFNNNKNACIELNNLYNSLIAITETIGGK